MRVFPLFLSLLAATAACRGFGEVLEVPSAADTTIFSINPDNSLGSEPDLIVGGLARGGHRARMLVRFPGVTNLPPGAVVTAVSVAFSVSRENSIGPVANVGLHRVLQAWGEGTGSGQTGSLAGNGAATWVNRVHPATAWGAPGGLAGTDFAAAASATSTWDAPARYTFASTAALVADVEGWRSNPAANQGWILVASNETVARSARRVSGREVAVAAQRPVLRVEYTLPQPPVPPEITSVTRVAAGIELRLKGESGWLYELQFREELSAGTWQALTNFVAKLQPLDTVVVEPVSEASRLYRLVGVAQVD